MTPVAAVDALARRPRPAPSVVAVTKTPTAFPHRRGRRISAPPPSAVVNSPGDASHSGDGAVGVPQRRTDDGDGRTRAAASAGTCWPASGASSRCTPTAAPPTPAAPRCARSTGPRWTARCRATRSSCRAAAPSRVTYARAMGPMQFLPGTWSRYASDGDGDGKADRAEPVRRDAGRRPLPVQRRAQPARSSRR